MKINLSRLALVAILAVAGSARAQEAANAPVPVLRASVASFDAVTKLLAEMEIPLPPMKPQLEGMFPFLGPDSVSSDRPLGIVLLASDKISLNSGEGVVFLVPVAEGKATAAAIAAAGGTPVEGKPDTFSLGGVNIRRAASYLLAQNNSMAGLAQPETVFATDYKTAGNVAVVSLDLAAAEKAAPEGYKQFIDQVKSSNKPSNIVSKDAAEEFGQSVVLNFFDKLEKVTLALAADESSIHIKTWLAPFPVKPVKPAPRPVFPGGMVMQAHFVYPDATWSGWAESLVNAIPNEAFARTTEAQGKRIKALLARGAKLYAGGDAVSIAVAVKEGKPVVYLVNQMSANVDYAAEITAINTEGMAISKEMGDATESSTVTSYTDAGKTVTRWTLTSKGGTAIVDAVQTGQMLAVTFSPTDGKYVAELAGLGTKGTTSSLCAGVLDLSEALKAASEGGGPLAMMPPNMLDELKTSFAGQGITWTVQGAEGANYVYTDVQLPKTFVKTMVKFAFFGVSQTQQIPMP